MPRAKKTADPAKIEHLLGHNVEEITDRAHLKAALESGRKLRVKLGIDPTSPDLHLGHAVVLSKLREFQALGHKAVLIIGDFTARIGDPSGRSATRKPLTAREVSRNLKEYLRQAGKVIDLRALEVRRNNEWFSKEGAAQALELASAGSIQQVLRRADFRKRLQEDSDITLMEMMYPLLQGYDSVKVKADVELGGTDQLFNLLMGRRVQRHFQFAEQDILTVPLLEGLDGEKKMSKSLGNYIGLTEKADDMFGKTMRLPDTLIVRWFKLATDLPSEEISAIERDLASGTNPKDVKQRLAFEIVKRYHGEVAAQKAGERWQKVFSSKDLSDTELAPLRVGILLQWYADDLVLKTGVMSSRSAAWRLIEQGGFEVNGKRIVDPRATCAVSIGHVVKVGKRHYFRIEH